MAKSADQMAGRWLGSMQSDETKARYQQGVEGVTESPMEKAASEEATQLYLKRTAESVRSGKRQNKLRAVPLSRYKDNAKGKGAERLGGGAKAAKPKVVAHFQEWAPRYQQISDEVAKLEKGTFEAAKARSAKAIEMAMRFAGRIQ